MSNKMVVTFVVLLSKLIHTLHVKINWISKGEYIIFTMTDYNVSVIDLKNKLFSYVYTPPKYQKIIHNDTILEDDFDLSMIQLDGKVDVQLEVEYYFKWISVLTMGGSQDIYHFNNDHMWTLYNGRINILKERIKEKTGIPMKAQQLVHGTKTLNEVYPLFYLFQENVNMILDAQYLNSIRLYMDLL